MPSATGGSIIRCACFADGGSAFSAAAVWRGGASGDEARGSHSDELLEESTSVAYERETRLYGTVATLAGWIRRQPASNPLTLLGGAARGGRARVRRAPARR